MGIEARHAYRFGYLQSEHWQNLRLEKLTAEDAKCFVCGCRDISNDVHHVHYPKGLRDVKISELRVLCREHHDRIHELVDIEQKKKPVPKDESRRKGYDFRNFRIAYEAILLEISPNLSTEKAKKKSRKPQKEKMEFDTDKCAHSAVVNERMRATKAERDFWGYVEKARKKVAKMRTVEKPWGDLPRWIKEEVEDVERFLNRIHLALVAIRKQK